MTHHQAVRVIVSRLPHDFRGEPDFGTFGVCKACLKAGRVSPKELHPEPVSPDDFWPCEVHPS